LRLLMRLSVRRDRGEARCCMGAGVSWLLVLMLEGRMRRMRT
jgi:hypothetical protein